MKLIIVLIAIILILSGLIPATKAQFAPIFEEDEGIYFTITRGA